MLFAGGTSSLEEIGDGDIVDVDLFLLVLNSAIRAGPAFNETAIINPIIAAINSTTNHFFDKYGSLIV